MPLVTIQESRLEPIPADRVSRRCEGERWKTYGALDSKGLQHEQETRSARRHGDTVVNAEPLSRCLLKGSRQRTIREPATAERTVDESLYALLILERRAGKRKLRMEHGCAPEDRRKPIHVLISSRGFAIPARSPDDHFLQPRPTITTSRNGITCERCRARIPRLNTELNPTTNAAVNANA